jgi:hypothetical protein
MPGAMNDVRARDGGNASAVADPYSIPLSALLALVAQVQMLRRPDDQMARANKLLLGWDKANSGDWEDAAAVLARRQGIRFTPSKPLHLFFNLVLGSNGASSKKRASEMALALHRLRKIHPDAVKKEIRRAGVRALAKPGAIISRTTKRRSKKLFGKEG